MRSWPDLRIRYLPIFGPKLGGMTAARSPSIMGLSRRPQRLLLSDRLLSYLACVSATMALTGCEPLSSVNQDDQAETFRQDIWETYQADRDARGLPPIAPETRAEWIELCETAPDASNRISEGCTNMSATGFPFPIHQVRTLCMFDDPNYGTKADASPYFVKNRNAARVAWGRFAGDIDPQEVCEAYSEQIGE